MTESKIALLARDSDSGLGLVALAALAFFAFSGSKKPPQPPVAVTGKIHDVAVSQVCMHLDRTERLIKLGNETLTVTVLAAVTALDGHNKFTSWVYQIRWLWQLMGQTSTERERIDTYWQNPPTNALPAGAKINAQIAYLEKYDLTQAFGSITAARSFNIYAGLFAMKISQYPRAVQLMKDPFNQALITDRTLWDFVGEEVLNNALEVRPIVQATTGSVTNILVAQRATFQHYSSSEPYTDKVFR